VIFDDLGKKRMRVIFFNGKNYFLKGWEVFFFKKICTPARCMIDFEPKICSLRNISLSVLSSLFIVFPVSIISSTISTFLPRQTHFKGLFTYLGKMGGSHCFSLNIVKCHDLKKKFKRKF